MKRSFNKILLMLIMSVVVMSSQSAFGMFNLKQFIASEAAAPVSLNKQVEILDQLKKELSEKLEEETAELNKVSAELASLKNKPADSNDESQEFFTKKQSILSHIYQITTEIIGVRKEMISIVEKHRTALQEYLADPTFTALQQKQKASSGFEDLQKTAQRLFTYKGRLEELNKAKKTTIRDRDKRKRLFDAVSKEYDEKYQQQQLFNQSTQLDVASGQFSHNQQGDLLDEQLRELNAKKRLAELKLNEDALRIALFDSQIFIAEKQVLLLQEEYAQVKRSLNIDVAYVKAAEKKLEKKRQKFFVDREKLQENIRTLSPLRDQLKRKIDQAIASFELSPNDASMLTNWGKDEDGVKTVDEWRALASLGSLQAQENLIETQIELLQAQINFAAINLRSEEREVAILSSWYRMTRHLRFGGEEELDQEVEKYKTERSQLRADLAELYEKRDNVISLLSRLNLVRDKIKLYVAKLENQRKNVFATKDKAYQEVLQNLMRADDEVRKRINFIGKLLEVYAKSIAKVKDSVKKIEDVIEELSAKSFWMRSTQSIEWKDLKNALPDVSRFIEDSKNRGIEFISSLSIKGFFKGLIAYVYTPYLVILFLFRLLIAIIAYILLRVYLPDLRSYLLQGDARYRFILKLRVFSAAVIDFINKHITSLYIWFLMLLAVSFNFVDTFFSISFCLISVPYLLYIIHDFFEHIIAVNEGKGYMFIGQSYQHRFMLVVPSLFYATIVISFFRWAFIFGNYYGSPLPDILLALNFILLQIALISLIGKEQVLGIFAGRNSPAFSWMEEIVEHYYYIFLLVVIAIIVMSNPYVGYGRQVFYVFSRLLLTCLLIPIFSWLHNKIKRASSDFFFYYSDGSAVKERFPAGKTWYGIFVVVSFLFFIFLGFMLIARVWGQGITLYDISQWFNYTLYSPGLDEVTGKPIQVTALSLVRVVMYLTGGFALAYIMNRFLLQRIFDPLLIGSGVQNTVLTLSRYAVVVVALLLGLQSAGLEGLATKLALVIVALGFAIREPISDFFSYFIILVQRPVKIGDLIQIDPDVIGVVRHITPRATIVRHRNSLTLIVPNSRVITHVVRNWHYTRTFGACRDITITLPYSVDPDRARDIMLKILDNNHNLLKNPAPIVWLANFGEFGFEFTIRGFLSADKIIEIFAIESEVRLDLVRNLRKEGITIATPVRLVSLQKNDVPFGETTKQQPAGPGSEPQGPKNETDSSKKPI